jgi:hypothetical protein
MKRHPNHIVLSGMLAVAVAFGVALPLGFWLRPRYPAMTDEVLGTVVAVVLVGIAAVVMFLLVGPLPLTQKDDSDPARRPDPDMDPNKPWSSDGSGCHTGYETSLADFRRLVSDPSSQPVIAPLLKDWFGCEIAGQGAQTAIRSQDGQVVGIGVLHTRIQLDRSRQRSIYQVAMDLWR